MATNVWTVVNFNPEMDLEPMVEVFDNEAAAQQCYEYYVDRCIDYVSIDDCPINSQFSLGKRKE